MKPEERVLCVDDEPNILEAMRRTMASQFHLVTALGGEEGLKRLEEDGPFAVVVSDLRMPIVDGVALLKYVSERSPATTRIMLTGNADVENAILAVNEGHIFRFLTKPCASSSLRAAIAAGIEQHRLVTSQRVLLEQTLRGSIRALAEMVALVHPLVGAQTSRVRRTVVQLAEALDAEDRWRIEVVALLAHLGSVTLPAETIEKVHHGRSLDAAERELLARAPEVAGRLIANIPRMDEVQAALMYQGLRWDGRNASVPGVGGESIPLAARLVRLATDLDLLESQGRTRAEAIAELHSRQGCYDPKALAALAETVRCVPDDSAVEVLTIRALRLGLIFEEDVVGTGGALVIARGAEVTQSLLDRIRDYWQEDMMSKLVRMRRPQPYGEGRAAA